MRIYVNRDYQNNCVECGKLFIIKYGHRNMNIQRCSRECMYKGMKGRKKSEEHKRKISLANKGISKPWSEERKLQKSIEKKGIYPLGHLTYEKRLDIFHKVSLAKKGKPNYSRRGNKSHFWKGGISKENHILRNRAEYKNWRASVFQRDNWTCVMCRDKSKKGHPVYLQADHIKPFAYYPELRFEISNGRTLCINCHKTTDSYLKKLS